MCSKHCKRPLYNSFYKIVYVKLTFFFSDFRQYKKNPFSEFGILREVRPISGLLYFQTWYQIDTTEKCSFVHVVGRKGRPDENPILQ